MNKVILGKLEEIKGLADEAKNYIDDFEMLEDFTVLIAQKVTRLGNEINKSRPSTGSALKDQFLASRFSLSMIPERYRPVKTR